jgi:hypothetical protein
MLRNIFFRLGLPSLLLSVSIVNAVPQSEKGDSWLYYGQKAVDEYKAKNYPAYLENAERALPRPVASMGLSCAAGLQIYATIPG